MGARPALLAVVVTAVLGTVLALVVLETFPAGADGITASPSPSPAVPSLAPSPSPSPSPTPTSIRLHALVTGLSQPVYVTAPPGDALRLFIVEKGGRILIFKDGALLATPFLDLGGQVSTGGEQGLLSMAFHPDYAANGRFFVDYTNLAGDTRVVEYKVSATDPDRADPSTRRVLLKVAQPYANHNGGQLQFGPNGRLYIGLGDGGSAGDPQLRAQNRKSRLGKILRMNVDVSPVRTIMYAYGVRNPWRFSFDRTKGNLWIGDVGQNRWEEIDYLRAGATPGVNFGWSYYEGSHVYKPQPIDRSRLRFPVAEYSHTFGEAVTGGYVYRGSLIPYLRGYYLYGDYATGRIWKMRGPDGRPTSTAISQKVTGISSFGQDAGGELYVVTLGGTVYKILPRF